MGCNTQHKDAVIKTLEQIDVVHRMVAANPDDFALVTTAQGRYITYIDRVDISLNDGVHWPPEGSTSKAISTGALAGGGGSTERWTVWNTIMSEKISNWNVLEVVQAFTEGKIGSLIGVEGGHSIGNSLAVLRLMFDKGVRYLTLTHSCTTPWYSSCFWISSSFYRVYQSCTRFTGRCCVDLVDVLRWKCSS